MSRRSVSQITLVFIVMMLLTASSVSAQSMPKGFVLLQEEVPGIIVELRYASEENFMGRVVKGYETLPCLISTPAAKALAGVQKELDAFGLGLKVFDAYRPQRAVDDFVAWAKALEDTKMKQHYYPHVAKRELFKQGYIAARSGHSRGSSVDLTIVSFGPDGPVELDMGTHWDLFDPKSWGRHPSIAPQQRANRMLLQTLMQKHGFIALQEEWWHFTLKAEPFPQHYFDFLIR